MRLLRLSSSFVEEHVGRLRARGLACTSHDVIAVWLIQNHGRELLPSRPRVNVRIPVNVRPLSRHVEPTYLGNAFVDTFLSWSEAELHALDVDALAVTIRGALERIKRPEHLDARLFVDEHGIVVQKHGGDSLINMFSPGN